MTNDSDRFESCYQFSVAWDHLLIYNTLFDSAQTQYEHTQKLLIPYRLDDQRENPRLIPIHRSSRQHQTSASSSSSYSR